MLLRPLLLLAFFPLVTSLAFELKVGRITHPARSLEYPIESTSRRRDLLVGIPVGLISVSFFALPSEAAAAYNPLNLKGSFWETGQLYTKSNEEIPSDSKEILASLQQTAEAFQSLTIYAETGKFDELSKLLRGGAISESQLRIRAYALIDFIEDDNKEYEASELFRIFLSDFDALDATVEAAKRKSSIDKGVVSTISLAAVSPLEAINEVAKISSENSSSNDIRIDVLAVLGETSKALLAFKKAAEIAIQRQ